MAKLELELNEETLKRARQSAETNHIALEQWIADAIAQAAVAPH